MKQIGAVDIDFRLSICLSELRSLAGTGISSNRINDLRVIISRTHAQGPLIGTNHSSRVSNLVVVV